MLNPVSFQSEDYIEIQWKTLFDAAAVKASEAKQPMGLVNSDGLVMVTDSIYTLARVAFLLGISIFAVGAYFRSQDIETPHFKQLSADHLQLKLPIVHVIKNHTLNLIRSFSMIALHAVIIVQLFLYMPIYLEKVAHIDPQRATVFNTINIVIFSALIPFFGFLSDRYGRKVFFIIASVLFLVLTYPLYSMIDSGVEMEAVIAMLFFAVMGAITVAVVPVTLAELFPTPVRNSAIGLTYNVGFAIFGGFTPVVATYLIHDFHNPAALSINLMVVAVILFIFMLFTHFSKNKTLP